MKSTPQGRIYDQPERDWLQQVRRRRTIWVSISFFVIAVTVIGFLNFFAQPESDQAFPTETEIPFIPHGRNAGGAAAQLLVSSLSPELSATPPAVRDEATSPFPEEQEIGGLFGAVLESGPSDAPFLRRKTLTSADVVTIASRYFLEEDVLRAIRLAWCLSRFNPQAIDPLTGHRGLFQHDPFFWPDHAQLAGFRGYEPFDPIANTAVAAYLVYEGSGWQTWDCRM